MDYKSIIGFSKSKKKQIKNPTSNIKKNTVLDEIKLEINEWSHKPPTTKRWSKSFNGKNGLTEFEGKGGKDNINEGPAAEYAKSHQRGKKAYAEFWDSIADFQRLLINKGLKSHGRQLDRAYNGVDKFYKFYFKMMDKLL